MRATARQVEVLSAIDRLTEEAGYPPTLRELGEVIGCTSTNAVAEMLERLETKGLIKLGPPRASRTMNLTGLGLKVLDSGGPR